MWFLRRFVEIILWITPYNEGELDGQSPLSLPLLPSSSPSVVVSVSSSGASVGQPGNCWSPTNRTCWNSELGLDIYTDYDAKTPNGVKREYTLIITNERIKPDGYWVDRMLINGTYPGPLIEGNWGDDFEIKVINRLKNFNGTSIHWHGLRQLNTTFNDGVAGVTQCPITPGENFVYKFRARQYGTSWYHSHFSLQYPDGIIGPLKINGPSSMNWDVDTDPLVITDWLHQDAFSLYQNELLGRPTAPDSNLLNGKGRYYCCPDLDPNCSGDLYTHEVLFQDGLSHRLSIVNTAVATQFTFWIDGHDFWVIATDFVPIQPFKTDTLNVAIGQRYEIVVEARNLSIDSQHEYWIHARNCLDGNARSTLGIIRYNTSTTQDKPFTPEPSRLCFGCLDESSKPDGHAVIPVVQRTVPKATAGTFEGESSLEVALEGFPHPKDKQSVLHKWILANSTLYLDWTQPSLSLITVAADMKENPFPPSYAPIILDQEIGTWVYFLIQGKFTETDSNLYKVQAPIAHPIHVHGHDFVILDQANTTFEFDKANLTYDNPPRRDTAMLPVNGYLVIAFQVDNPGAWLMHCHIAWHASSGLALQFIEKPKQIKPLMQEAGIFPQYHAMCSKWGTYYKMYNEPENAIQEDSGI